MINIFYIRQQRMLQGFIPQIKICICGSGGVGKTNYLNRLSTGEFEKKYVRK